MVSGGRILWNDVAIWKMTKTSWQTGNLKMNEDLGNLSRTCFVRGRNLGRRYSDCQNWRIGKLDASDIYPRRLNAKEVLITHKDGEFVSLVADGSATLSGRNYEFQEPTLRRESTVKRENLSGESLDGWEEFRPEESEFDAEARKDFWSIQEDFIYRHHIEPRVQFYVPREESFLISHDFYYTTKLLREEIYDPRRGAWRKSKWHHVQITKSLTLGEE